MLFDINWKAIFDQIRRIIEVITKRFFQTKEWVDEYTSESAAS
jgi:hypothetical protein